jgi:hypothetical protein
MIEGEALGVKPIMELPGDEALTPGVDAPAVLGAKGPGIGPE